MEFMPVFGLVGNLLGGLGGGKEKSSPAPAAAPEREKAPQVPETPATAGQKQRVAVRNSRQEAGVSGSSLSTRSGVAIVGG